MPFRRVQDLLDSTFDVLDKIRRLILKRRTTIEELISQLDESNNRLKWYKKHLELHRRHESNMPRYVNKYEVFECEFGQNIKQEINKRRPCVIIQSYSSVVVVAPIMHKKMISFDLDNWTIKMPENNGGVRTKKVPIFTFPVEQDLSFRPGLNDNWQQSKLNGCIELGHLRVVSKIRLSKMLIGKLSSKNICELNQRLFDFLNIDICNLDEFNRIKDLNMILRLNIETLVSENKQLIQKLEKFDID